MAQRNDDGAGQRRQLYHCLRLEFLLGVPHGIAQDQAAFGVGIDDLDGLARHRRDHVARARRIAVGHVLDQGADAHNIGLGLAPGQKAHRAGDGAGAAHVPFHVFHAACGLQRDAAGVEGHAFADQRDRLLVLGSVHPAHHEELRLAFTALADRHQHVHAELLELSLAQDLDLDAELREFFGAAGELARKKHVGRLAHQIAGHEDRVDRGLELGIDLPRLGRPGQHDGELGQRKLLLGLVLRLVLVEAIVAQTSPERDVRRDLARRQPAALDRVDDHRDGRVARRVGLGRHQATQAFRAASVEFPALPRP